MEGLMEWFWLLSSLVGYGLVAKPIAPLKGENSNKQNHSSFASLKKSNGKEINEILLLRREWNWLDVFTCFFERRID